MSIDFLMGLFFLRRLPALPHRCDEWTLVGRLPRSKEVLQSLSTPKPVPARSSVHRRHPPFAQMPMDRALSLSRHCKSVLSHEKIRLSIKRCPRNVIYIGKTSTSPGPPPHPRRLPEEHPVLKTGQLPSFNASRKQENMLEAQSASNSPSWGPPRCSTAVVLVFTCKEIGTRTSMTVSTPHDTQQR